jgi:multimeric flavodoxin WrbA
MVRAMVEGIKENGKEVEVYRLNALPDAKGCQACMGCKSAGHCIQKDDHTVILKAIRDAEGLILSTPTYFGEANGQFRLFQDRFYSFLGPNFVPNIEGGKKLAVVVSCGGGVDDARAMADKLEGSMVNFFKFVPVGKIVLTGARAPDTAANNKAILEEAKAIGKKF